MNKGTANKRVSFLIDQERWKMQSAFTDVFESLSSRSRYDLDAILKHSHRARTWVTQSSFFFLYTALCNGKLGNFKTLLTYKAQVKASPHKKTNEATKAFDQKTTILIHACVRGTVGFVKAILGNIWIYKQYYINRQDSHGNTALIYAVRNKKTDSVKYLMQQGANTSLKNVKGKTAADYANSDVMKKILSGEFLQDDDDTESQATTSTSSST